MQVTPEQGAFLALLARVLGARRYLELGVFTGYSLLAVAEALPPAAAGGVAVALDSDAAALEAARGHWDAARLAPRADWRLGKAADTLRGVSEEYGRGAFDFAFVDADKRGYRGYFEALLPLVRPGGIIAFDNVLWYGRVADPTEGDRTTAALRELNDALLIDERVDLSIVPVGDGMALCRVR